MNGFVCQLCGRNCNIDRENSKGKCSQTNNLKIAKACLHFGEEPCISGANGSGTIFFSGCSLNCVYCQNNVISQNNFGKEITVERLAEIFKELEMKGANNINLVTPTHFLPQIEATISLYKPKIPIVYNTGGYDNENTIKRASKFVDIFLFDLKYLSNSRAKRYSNAENYPKIATDGIKTAISLVPENQLNEQDIMQKGIIIRHLLLPQGTEEAKTIIDWVKSNAENCYFSLMSQYTPIIKQEIFTELNRTVTNREYEKVLNYLIEKDLKKKSTKISPLKKSY